MNPRTNSLRWRVLLPIVSAALPTAILVALLSFYLGRSWALQDVDRRGAAIQSTLANSSFPLTSNVVDLLAELTSTEWVTFNTNGELDNQSGRLVLEPEELLRLANARDQQAATFSTDGDDFLVRRYRYGAQESTLVLVLFDERDIREVSRRYAVLPFLAGLATIFVLSIIVWMLLRPVLLRLESLQQRVTLIAAGDFTVRCKDPNQDELALLGGAVDSMAEQLQKLWQEVNVQQATKLLHQLAGGLAHQLRNTLTGSKMAIELYARQNNAQSAEEIQVALSQLNSAEDYVSRLLLVSKGSSGPPEPARAQVCLDELQSSLRQTAVHLGKELVFERSEIGSVLIDDRGSFVEAISNLILNAIHEATRKVQVHSSIASGKLIVAVSDDGPGVNESVRETLFQPFVSTKPEGIGLGLPAVAHAAARLGGQVQWERDDGETKFILTCEVRGSIDD